MTTAQLLIFTDLDGTFLDHHTYSFDEALPALQRLNALAAQIIPVTSKTLAEVKALNLPLNDTVQIGENGMVISAEGQTPLTDKNYNQIIDFIEELPKSLKSHITGFHNMGIQDVIRHTGLPEERAMLAKDRQASEPFLWAGDQAGLDRLMQRAARQGFKITRGGRFYHLMGQGGKEQAVMRVIKQFQIQRPDRKIISIALGDGLNDSAMLASVDYGIQIPSSSGQSFTVENPRGVIIKAPYAGPKGWNASINSLLDDLPLQS